VNRIINFLNSKTFAVLIVLSLMNFTVIASENTRVISDLVPVYSESTQVLSITKLGVASGDSGYAYQVDMKLFSTDPIGFVVSNLSLTGTITDDEELSALYDAASHSIVLPQVTLLHADNSQTELKDIKLSIGADPFVWFYVAAATE